MTPIPTPLKTLLLLLIIAVSAVGTISLSTYIARGPVSSSLNAQSRGGGSGGVTLGPTIPRNRGGGSGGGALVNPTINPGQCGSRCSNTGQCTTGTECRNGVCVEFRSNRFCSSSSPCCFTNFATPIPRSTSGVGGFPSPISGGSGGTRPSGSVDQPTGTTKQPPADGSQPISGQPPQIGLLGDCSGSTPGVPDGIVDLLDFRQLSIEFNGQSSTLACDFDKNGIVDLIDFSDYFRKGFLGGR